MALAGVLLTEINELAAESAEQDQTARTCSLILLVTLRKIRSWLRKITQGLLAFDLLLDWFIFWAYIALFVGPLMTLVYQGCSFSSLPAVLYLQFIKRMR